MKPSVAGIVFDWDEVVFDTASFKERLSEALAAKGIPREAVRETVGIAKDAHGYNPAVHALMIAARSGSSVPAITREIWAACRLLAEALLFPDAVKLIREARRRNIPLYVLSAGQRRFQ